jgi:hypothetical protein
VSFDCTQLTASSPPTQDIEPFQSLNRSETDFLLAIKEFLNSRHAATGTVELVSLLVI